MKLKFAAATAALVALSLPAMSSAEDKLKYEDLVHCAATNQVIAGVFSLDDGATKNKTQIETYNSQATALQVIAAVGSSKDAKMGQLSPCVRLEGVAYNMYEHESPHPSPVS